MNVMFWEKDILKKEMPKPHKGRHALGKGTLIGYFQLPRAVSDIWLKYTFDYHISQKLVWWYIIYIMIQLGWRDFTGFSPRIQQFSSRFRRELLNSPLEISNSRRIFSNSRQRIRRELLILQKITTKREKRKVNLVATENWANLTATRFTLENLQFS